MLRAAVRMLLRFSLTLMRHATLIHYADVAMLLPRHCRLLPLTPC